MSDNDFEDQLTSADTLEDPDGDLDDALDAGNIPADRWSVGEGFGNTPYEEATGETLDQRIAQEEPEEDPYEAAEKGDDPDDEDDLDDGEVGDRRAGRLVDLDEGLGEDTEKDLVGDDVGIDGGAASAEEAAMHIVEDV